MHFSVTTLCLVLLLASVGTFSALAAPAPAPAPRDDPFIESTASPIRPIMSDPHCYMKCSAIPDEVCAENRKKQQKTFVNACQLGQYNCMNPKRTFKVVHDGACENACDSIILPIP
ncbi:hypothetical protein BGW39_009429 [Mortierella sp. 14UC]|nr:hypothetical protein BGW39_009429 [Mortierella sp. 14UC]